MYNPTLFKCINVDFVHHKNVHQSIKQYFAELTVVAVGLPGVIQPVPLSK